MNVNVECTHEMAVVCIDRVHESIDDFAEYWGIREDCDYFLYYVCRWCDSRYPMPRSWDFNPDAWIRRGDSLLLPGSIVIGQPLAVNHNDAARGSNWPTAS